MAITPGYYVFTATERSFISSNAPTLPAITAALRPVRLYMSAWVGPKPRVTRRPNPSALRMFVTQVTWLVRSTTSLASLTTYATGELSTLMQTLGRLGNFTDVTFTPYDPDVNGTVGWWESGAAASSSTTRDAFSQSAPAPDGAWYAPPDNPLGPTTRADHATTAAEALGDARDAVTHAAGAARDAIVNTVRDAGHAAADAAGDAANHAGDAAKAALWELEKAIMFVGVAAGAVYFGPALAPPLLAWLKRTFPAPAARAAAKRAAR